MSDTQWRYEALLEKSARHEEASVALVGGGLFVPELLLGRGAGDPDDEQRIAQYLVEVARARGVPLHPAVAWNCLYFRYDPQRSGYDASALGPIVLPTLVSETRREALPVGALVEYSSGTEAGRMAWAEVIYKEGQPPTAIGPDGLVGPAWSGAAGIVGADPSGDQVLSELLVLDFQPLGPLSRSEKNWLDRARGDPGRSYIDELGHVRVEASYPDQEAAEMSNGEYFCSWMLSNHHELLARGWLGAALDDPDDTETLAEALANSLDAVEGILDKSGAFSEWSGYWYLNEHYDADADPDLPGGSADASSIVTSLCRVPKDRHIVYRAFSPYLKEVVGHTPLRYGGYARHAVITGALVAEVLAERAPDGICLVQGEAIVLRLDDAWLYSGVWRAERLTEGVACSLVGFPATITLGLGASGEAGHEDTPLPPEETSADGGEAGAEDEKGAEEGSAEHEDSGGELVFWTTALREAHRNEQRLAVDKEAWLVGGSEGDIVLRLVHQGEIEDDERVQHVGISANGEWLSPVRFPFDFFTGIRLNCLARRGGSVVRAATELLPEGQEIAGVRYDFAFDRSLVDPTRPAQGRPPLGRLALSALIRHGEKLAAGWRRLSSTAIAEILFGPDLDDETVAMVTEALASTGRGGLDGGFWYCRVEGGRGGGPMAGAGGTPGDGALFAGTSAALSESVAQAAVRHRREHRVVLHLRQLVVSDLARPERQAEYRYWRERAPNRASLPEHLPAGYTFVVAHTRGR